MNTITLLTSAGAVRVAGENLVIDLRQPETANETMGGLPVAAASETAEETGRTPAYTRMGRDGTPHRSGVTGGESAATNSSGSVARGQAALSGECPEAPPMDGARKGPSGTAAPIHETPANTSAPQARQATAARASTASQGARAPNSSNDAIGEVKARSRLPNAAGVEPSLPEADAGGPVSASAPHSDPAERHPARSVSSAFVSSQPAGSVGVPHSKPHKSGEVKVQPANLSDPRDPGPIPSFMDKRAKKDAA